MKLFHGTNIDFQKIDLSKCLPRKDFGKGFYLTTSRKRAQERAMDKCDKEGSGTPVIQEYEFDESVLDKLSVKRFDNPDNEWLDFILYNRQHSKGRGGYDLVIGPVADDGVILSINLYEAHVIDKPTLLKRLEYAKPYIQYCFLTERAIKSLERK